MDSQAQVVGLKYSICRSFLRAVRYDWPAGGYEFGQFSGKGVPVVIILFIIERGRNNKTVSFFHNFKFLIQRHDDSMMTDAILQELNLEENQSVASVRINEIQTKGFSAEFERQL